MKYLVVLIFVLIFTSCAHPKKTKADFAKQRREALMAKYAHMRLHPHLYPPPKRYKYVLENRKKNPGSSFNETKTPKRPRDPEEIRIELEQHMAYYCIKNDNIEDCDNKTRELLLDCELQQIEDPELDLISCLKTKL